MTRKILLLKSAGIPAGSRWITVHPSPGGKGQPILIQPQPDGSARVIGGAGGSLNFLKLRNVKSKEQYKEESAASKAEAKQKRKEQIKADKEAGIHDVKQAARKALKEKKQAAERHVIGAVAEKMGWDKKELEFPEQDYQHLSPEALVKVRDKHHKQLLQRAKSVITQGRERLVNDPAMRADAGIGEVPLNSQAPDAVSVADLNPLPELKASLGFNSDFKSRAESNGLTQDQLAHEVDQLKQAKLAEMTDSQRKAVFSRRDGAALIKKELDGIKEPAAPKADASLLSAKDAMDLLKEGKKLQQIEKAARAANAEIDKAKSEPKAYVIEASDADVDAKVAEDIANDLRTIQTTSFLSEVHKIAGASPEETLGGHIGVGAYNSINSLALAVGGEALVDRSVVDVLGIAGAAQVLARRLQNDLEPDELQHVSDGAQDFHLNHYMQTASESLKKARELTDAAKAIEISPEATNGADLSVAQELNARRRACIGDAQRILGQSLGEMEANAALVVALKGKNDGVQVSLGKISPQQAVTQIRAIGLLPSDYQLEQSAGDTFLTINGAGMDRLAKPVNREDVQQVRRNLSIIRGDQDEDNWLPLGVANRPDMAMDVEPGVAERFAIPFAPGADLEQSLKDYIGARAADGDSPADILADVQSADFFKKAGSAEAYRAALDAVAPLKGADGKMQRAEALSEPFDKLADEYVAKLGGDRSTLNKQKFSVDQASVDALHRALAETPEGTAAYKQIGELTNSDQRAIREFFAAHIAKDSPEAGQLKADLNAHEADEPEKETTDIFGDTSTSPVWTQWKSKRDDLASKVNSSSLTWAKYVNAMGGNAKAYEAVQDAIRSKVAKSFTDAHNRLNPKSPLKLGKQVIRNNLTHLDAVDPSARAARAEKQKALVDSMRERSGGKYASGSVADKLAAEKEQKAAYDQSQMGFFSSEESPDPVPNLLASDERHTLGHAAELQLAGMMGKVGQNFKPGQPTKLWGVSMSGKYAPQQRAIKLLAANKRLGLAAGAGSGKTNMMLGGFAHLHELGKAKRAIFCVPSIVQGQFGGEALRLLEPGKFKWHIQPGASQAERIAAYKDPETHICVMTHQSFRDDMIHLASKHAGISEAEMTDKIGAMTPDERKQWAADTMAKEGINFDASFVDEAHDTLNRAGKENSSMANVLDSVTSNTPYYTYASGDPVKNDPSEIHSMLQKLDPERYKDRGEFMRRYGADTIASKQALKREMARYVFPTSITPDVERSRTVEKVQLSAGQQKALGEFSSAMSKARLAQMAGKADIEAAKVISPSSFEGVPESEHENVAKTVQKSLGIIKSSAINRIINTHSDNAKVARAVELVKAREGKQGVIFARNKAAVEQYKKAMEAAGKRVVTITGADTAKDKDAKRKLFNPESGEAKADVLIASDAGAVGMNLQSGQYLIQHDVSDTAKTHSQRQARIDRIGQKHAIELIDLVADHPEEYKARDRLMKKYDLKNMMADPIDGLDDTGIAAAINARRNAANIGE